MKTTVKTIVGIALAAVAFSACESANSLINSANQAADTLKKANESVNSVKAQAESLKAAVH